MERDWIIGITCTDTYRKKVNSFLDFCTLEFVHNILHLRCRFSTIFIVLMFYIALCNAHRSWDLWLWDAFTGMIDYTSCVWKIQLSFVISFGDSVFFSSLIAAIKFHDGTFTVYRSWTYTSHMHVICIYIYICIPTCKCVLHSMYILFARKSAVHAAVYRSLFGNDRSVSVGELQQVRP